ncbi:MAG: hypothetical protein AAF357_19490, partial [Verrucomicrobiota bacterium]
MKPHHFLIAILLIVPPLSAQSPSAEKLNSWLKRFPEADTNKDGKLTADEAIAYRNEIRGNSTKSKRRDPGAPREFDVDPRWEGEQFPEDAVFRLSPEKIAKIYADQIGDPDQAITSF